MASVRNWDDGTINNPELEQNIMEELNTLVTTTYNAGLERAMEVVQNRINELMEYIKENPKAEGLDHTKTRLYEALKNRDDITKQLQADITKNNPQTP